MAVAGQSLGTVAVAASRRPYYGVDVCGVLRPALVPPQFLLSGRPSLLDAYLEMAGSLIGLTFAANALVRFRGTHDRISLILAFGFVLAGLIGSWNEHDLLSRDARHPCHPRHFARLARRTHLAERAAAGRPGCRTPHTRGARSGQGNRRSHADRGSVRGLSHQHLLAHACRRRPEFMLGRSFRGPWTSCRRRSMVPLRLATASGFATRILVSIRRSSSLPGSTSPATSP